MLLSDSESHEIWDRVCEEFRFQPSVYKNVPFKIKVPYVVYDIGGCEENKIDLMQEVITDIFIDCTKEGERMYALDWQHSDFLFDIRKPEEQRSFFVKDERYHGGGYMAYFPSYYPDGDYYFFIAEDFRFGYLGHPWQQKVWIFGNQLIQEFKEIAETIGFVLDSNNIY